MTEDALKNTVIDSGNINITLTDGTKISIPNNQLDERSTILWDKDVQVTDSKNNVIAIYDAKTGEWRKPISKEFSEAFPAVWTETTEGYADGLYIPITIGLTEGVVNNPTFPVKEVHMTKEGANAVASIFLHSCWARYRDLMGHPDTTYSEYIALVKTGQGDVDVLVTDDNGVAKVTAHIDPRQGFSEVWTDEKNMPIKANDLWGFLVQSDETGKLILSTNTYAFLVNADKKNGGKIWKTRDMEWFRTVISNIAFIMGSTPNKCMEATSVQAACGSLPLPKDFLDWTAPIAKNFIDYQSGSAKPMFTIVR